MGDTEGSEQTRLGCSLPPSGGCERRQAIQEDVPALVQGVADGMGPGRGEMGGF